MEQEIDVIEINAAKEDTNWARKEYARKRAKEAYDRKLLAEQSPRHSIKKRGGDVIDDLENITFDYKGNAMKISMKPRHALLPTNVSAIEYGVIENNSAPKTEIKDSLGGSRRGS